jgi:cytochrome c biogenesis factor
MEADQMTAGDILLYLAFISTCLAAMYIFTGHIKQGILITRIATVLSTLCVLLLVYAFIFLDFSLIYAWQRNSAELSILYRIAAILTGQEGTYLVWAWLSLIVVFVYIELNNEQEPVVRLASVYALVGCAFLFALTITCLYQIKRKKDS